MMRLTLIVACAAVSGCCTLPHEVKVPVPVPCKVEMPQRPAWATVALAKDADIFDQAKALLAERRQRVAYETQLEAAIEGCQ